MAGPGALLEILLLGLAVVDVAFLGQTSQEHFGGATLARAIQFPFLLFGIGVASALEPKIAEAVAKKDDAALGRWLGAGLVVLVPVAAAIPIGSLLVLAGAERVGIDHGQAARAHDYLVLCGPTTYAYLVFVALRTVVLVRRKGPKLVVAAVVANLLNVAACSWGARAGLLTASTVCILHGSLFTLLTLAAYALVRPPSLMRLLERGTLKSLWVNGRATGLQLFAEAATSAFVGVLVAHAGERENNAYQAVGALTSLAFMFSFGIGDVASLRTATAIANGTGTREAAIVALGLNAVVVVVGAVILFVGGPSLLGAFGLVPEALTLGSELVRIAAFTNAIAGTLVVVAGALRGCNDFDFPARVSLAAYGLVSAPLTLVLSFVRPGAVGGLLGFSVGQALVLAALVWRIRDRWRNELG